VVTIFDSGAEGGAAFLVMELLPGQSGDLCGRGWSLAWAAGDRADERVAAGL